MSLVKTIFFFVFVALSASMFAQDIPDINQIDDPQEQINLLIKKAKPYSRSNPDSARYYYQIGLKIAQKKANPIQEARMLRIIAKSFYTQRQYDTCLILAQRAIDISEKENDYKGLISAYIRKGYVGYFSDDYVNASLNFQKTIDYAVLVKDTGRMVNGYILVGGCQYQIGKYPEALNAFQSALHLGELTKNLKIQAKALNNIGNIQDELKNYNLALSYLQQAVDIKNKLGDVKGATDTRENMATVYSKTKQYDRALEQYKSILRYKRENKEDAGVSITLMNIGYIYEKLGKLQSALEHYSESLKILYRIDDSKNLAVCLNNIGDIYYALGKYQQAIDSSKKSLEIGKKLNIKSSVKSTALSLTNSYVKRRDFKQAYYYHVLYSDMKDSLFNEESAKVLQEMETKYQTEKKQQEIEKQNLLIDKQQAQSRSQRIMLMAMLGGLILVILIAIQVFRGYKQKKKANALLSSKNAEIEEKNLFLNEANIEISQKKAEIEEKNLNIMDSIRYAKRIQQTILPRDVFIEKNLPQSFILYKPKDIVSGDFYWAERVANRIFIAAVDCTGHGVPGAFVSIVGYNSLNRTVMEFKLTKPGEILNKLNDLVVDTFVRHSDSDIKDGMDMSLLTIDQDTGAIEFAGAQNPLYIVNAEGLVEIKGNKQPIGSSLEAKYFDNHVVDAQKGDMLYLFSDGYIDQFGGPKGKKFMRKRFKEILQSIHQMDVQTQKLHLDNTIKDWMKDEDQLDDILVIGIRV
jgi:serine phosphatase RsbU (regulator of sigma subunit)